MLLALLSLIFLQEGIGKHNTVLKTIRALQAYEQSKVSRYINYPQYGTYGVRILFAPSPIEIFFFNSSSISELTAAVDSGERLKLYNSYKGRSIFTEKTGGFKDFSGIMLLFGSAFALFMGHKAFLHKDYLRFMSGITGERILFFTMVSTRIFLITLFLGFTAFLSLVLLIINKIPITGLELQYLGVYFGILLLVWIFFFMIGASTSSFKSRVTGPIVLLAAWFTLIFIVPSLINSYIYSQAEKIESEISMENSTFNMLMDAEKELNAKFGSIHPQNQNPQEVWDEIRKHLAKEIKQIQAMERSMEDEIQNKTAFHQKLSIWIPSAFYLSTGNEISSKGYINYISFYRYVQELKFKFIPYIMEKGFQAKRIPVSANSKPRVESFFKDNEDIFEADPVLPSCFWGGIGIIILYISLLTGLSYFRFQKSLRL